MPNIPLIPAWSFVCESVIWDMFTQRFSFMGQYDNTIFHDAPERFTGKKHVLVPLACEMVFYWKVNEYLTEEEIQEIEPKKATVRFVNPKGELLVTEEEIPFVKNKRTKQGYTGVIMVKNFPVLGWGEYTITVTPVGYEASVHKASLLLERHEAPARKAKKKKKRAASKKSKK